MGLDPVIVSMDFCMQAVACLTKSPDTVGQPPSTEIGVPNLPSLKAKKWVNFPEKKYS